MFRLIEDALSRRRAAAAAAADGYGGQFMRALQSVCMRVCAWD